MPRRWRRPMSIPGPQTVEVPVLIVGAGPAGLALSVALSRYGVGHLLVERHRDTAHTPRAHIINQRTVEIFRHLGISDRFHAVATPQHLMANNLWGTTLAGLEGRAGRLGGRARGNVGARRGPARRLACGESRADGQLPADRTGTDAPGRR